MPIHVLKRFQLHACHKFIFSQKLTKWTDTALSSNTNRTVCNWTFKLLNLNFINVHRIKNNCNNTMYIPCLILYYILYIILLLFWYRVLHVCNLANNVSVNLQENRTGRLFSSQILQVKTRFIKRFLKWHLRRHCLFILFKLSVMFCITKDISIRQGQMILLQTKWQILFVAGEIKACNQRGTDKTSRLYIKTWSFAGC